MSLSQALLHSISNGLRQGLVQTSVNYRFTNADIKFVLFFKLEHALACVQMRLPFFRKRTTAETTKPAYVPGGVSLSVP